MSRLFLIPSGHMSKFIVFLTTFVVFLGVTAAFSGKFEGAQKNETASFLPGDTESVKALKAVEQYPGGEVAPAVIIYQPDDGLNGPDKVAIGRDVPNLNTDRSRLVEPAGRP